MMKQSSAVFEFKKEYLRKTHSKETVTIRIDIDYDTKSFYIHPNHSDHFIFRGKGNFEPDKWIVIAELIKEATEFGAQEIGLKPKPPTAV